MPLYDFKCEQCGHEYEGLIVPAKKDQKQQCPKCQGHHAVRQLSSHGGYHISGNNSASQRPKGAGSFKK